MTSNDCQANAEIASAAMLLADVLVECEFIAIKGREHDAELVQRLVSQIRRLGSASQHNGNHQPTTQSNVTVIDARKIEDRIEGAQ